MHRYTDVSQAVSSLLMKCGCCPSHDAHIPKWEGGTVVYFDKGWKIPLPSLGMLHHPWAWACFSGFFLPEVLSWESSAESHAAGQKLAGLQLRLPRQEAQFIFFSRMYIKAQKASGGISAGTPLMNRMTTLHSLFSFFSTRPHSPPSVLKPPTLNSLSSTDETRLNAAQTSSVPIFSVRRFWEAHFLTSRLFLFILFDMIWVRKSFRCLHSTSESQSFQRSPPMLIGWSITHVWQALLSK